MPNTSLAGYANLAVYSAMAVLTLATLAYAVFLARWVPARAETVASVAPESELVPAYAGTSTAYTGGSGDAGADQSAVAAAAEVTAPAEPLGARKAAGIGLSLTWLATLLLAVGVGLRGWSVQRWPLGNMHEFATFGSLAVLAVFAFWARRRDLRWLGIFVVAPVLLVLGLAITVWYTEAAELVPSLKSVWLVIHVTVATISVALFGIGFALACLSLVRDRLATSGRPAWMTRVPGGAALEKLAYSLHIIAFPLWTFTLIAGAIWARQAWGSYWNWDPKEVWTFVIWAVYAAYLHARATTGVSRRTATWIAIAGFLCIVINYAVVNVWFVGQHSYSGIS